MFIGRRPPSRSAAPGPLGETCVTAKATEFASTAEAADVAAGGAVAFCERLFLEVEKACLPAPETCAPDPDYFRKKERERALAIILEIRSMRRAAPAPAPAPVGKI